MTLVLFKYYGLSQSILLAVSNLWFLIYLIHYKPLKDKTDLYIQIFYEAMNSLIGILVVALSFLDITGDFSSNTRMNLGWAIIGVNFAIIGASGLIGLISAIASI